MSQQYKILTMSNHDDISKMSPDNTLDSEESHVALSAVPIPSSEARPNRSRGRGLFVNSPESSDGYPNSYVSTSSPYEFPMVAPPAGYSPESTSISADELQFTKSGPSTAVLGDLTALDSDLSDQCEQEVRDAIFDQMEPFCRKVFVGSVPCGVSSADLEQFFSRFGTMTIDYRLAVVFDKCGYAFVIFDRASSVNKLLDACMIGEDSTHVIHFPYRGMQSTGKFLVIRAWHTRDSYWKNSLIRGRLGNRFSVFVGGVPRVCSAVYLAQVFDHEFGNVGKVTIELEPNTGFPKGVARITFFDREPYMNAINRKRVKLFILKPMKEVEVKPYLESSMRCEQCLSTLTDKFCAGPECNLYICESCFPLHCATYSSLMHTMLCRYENTENQSQSVYLAQLGFQGTPHNTSKPEMITGRPTALPSLCDFSADTNPYDEIRDNSNINVNNNYYYSNNADYMTASDCFGPNGGFRNVADLISHHIDKRNQTIAFHAVHRRHHNSNNNNPIHGSMLHSLPNRRTPIGHIIPQEQMKDYSLRVFLGGMPRKVNPDDLTEFFTSFGQVSVDIDPSGEAKHAFLHFTCLAAVRALVAHCQEVDGKLTLPVFLESKKALVTMHVRPWLKHNRVWMNGNLPINYDLNSTSTRYSIFIGGVPRSATASELAQVVQSHFGDVALLMIDVDSVFEYPRGSARAVFLTKDVYVRALQQKYLTVYSGEQPKEVELKPFVDSEVMCEICGHGSFRSFCPELCCLKYFCEICWEACHIYFPDHKPLRTTRLTYEEKRAKRRGDKIVAPPMLYADTTPTNYDPFGHGDLIDALRAPNSSSISDTFLSSFNQLNLAPPFASKDFGPIGSGRPN